MNRAKIALLLLTGCAAAMGCRMCAHPYDCYGPTWLGCPGEPTWEFERAGSAFSGYGHAGHEGVVIDGAQELEAVPADPGQPAEPQRQQDPGLVPPPAGGAFPDGMTSAPQSPRSRSALRQRH
jgi:hypothetical protein